MSTATAPDAPAVLAGQVVSCVDTLRGVDLDAWSDDDLRAALVPVTTAIRRLQAIQTRVAGSLTTRARAAAKAAAEDADTAARDADRAASDVQKDLVDDHHMSHPQAKKLTETDRKLQDLPYARAAFDDGAITDEHVRLLHKLLSRLSADLRAELEPHLVDEATRQDPVTFGRTCRGVQAQLDADQAAKDHDDQHARRSGRISNRPDGTTWLGVEVSGVDGEWLHTAIDAFTTKDAKGERRTREQRVADAVVEMARAALGTINDPDARSARPVFLLKLPAQPLLGDAECDRLRAGNGLTTFTGPLPAAVLARMIGDAHIAALLADGDGLPLAVTRQVRTVPAGLWRLLRDRDGGCITTGCDAPPGWCQVAHLADPYRKRGKLSPGNAALLCHRHHTAFDTGKLAITWTDNRPIAHRRTAPTADRKPRPAPLWERFTIGDAGTGPPRVSRPPEDATAASADPPVQDGQPPDGTPTASADPPVRNSQPPDGTPTASADPPCPASGRAEPARLPGIADLASEPRGSYTARPVRGSVPACPADVAGQPAA